MRVISHTNIFYSSLLHLLIRSHSPVFVPIHPIIFAISPSTTRAKQIYISKTFLEAKEEARIVFLATMRRDDCVVTTIDLFRICLRRVHIFQLHLCCMENKRLKRTNVRLSWCVANECKGVRSDKYQTRDRKYNLGLCSKEIWMKYVCAYLGFYTCYVRHRVYLCCVSYRTINCERSFRFHSLLYGLHRTHHHCTEHERWEIYL